MPAEFDIGVLVGEMRGVRTDVQQLTEVVKTLTDTTQRIEREQAAYAVATKTLKYVGLVIIAIIAFFKTGDATAFRALFAKG